MTPATMKPRTPILVEEAMAWVEQISASSWRVRYFRDEGGTGSMSGFPTRDAALEYATVMAFERRRGGWVDPVAGKVTLAVWANQWVRTLALNERTEENYRRRLHRHVLPRWSEHRLCDITTAQINQWARDMARAGYARSTIASQIKLLSMLLNDAADARLIETNPVRRRRGRGRRTPTELTERIWATPEQVVQIAPSRPVPSPVMVPGC